MSLFIFCISYLEIFPNLFHELKMYLFGFSFAYPSLKTLGEDLVTVLDFLHVKYIIGLGEVLY